MKKLFLILIISFVNHLSFSQMVTNYTSSAQSCDCYTITNAVNNTVGSVFSPNTINLNNPFNFTFNVNMGANDTWGADGIVFVLQQGQSATPTVAQNLGYAGITPSVGIEIDTWENAGVPYNDPASDHVTIMSNGDFTSVLTPSVGISNIEDNAIHTVNIQWDPVSQVLAIFIDGAFISGYNGDIINNIFGGNPNVYFGFTGATGGLNNLQTFCMYRNASFTQNQTNVCIGETVNFTDNSTSDLGQITYLWDFGDGVTSTLQNPSHSWATSGTKNVTLTISDPSGCTDIANVNIIVAPAINANFNVTDVNCYGGNDGAINTTPTNGSAPYSYNWDIPSTAQNPNGLSAGTYNLTITDNNGCTGNLSATVNEPTSALSITTAPTTDASCGTNNGTITVNAIGGTTNYQYSINGGALQNSNVFNGLASGNYTVLVQDANNCTASLNVTVNQVSMMSITNITTIDATCNTNNGTITVDIQNGTAPYTYTLNTGATNTNSSTTYTFNGLAQGSYSISVTDANSCSVSQLGITVNNASTLSIDNANCTTTDVSCNGGNDGALTIAYLGGIPNYQYSIDGGITYQNSNSFSNLTANTYTIQVLDGNSCVATSTLTINEPTPLSIDNITIDNQVTCNGGNDAQITVSASGGNGNYTYSIDGGTTTQNSNVFNGLSAGNYTLTLLEGVNCSTTTNGSFIITEPQPIIINTVTPTDVTCNGANDGAINVVSVSGGTPAYQYSLDGVTYQTQTNFTNLGFGTYTVYVTDNNTCGPTTLANININESAPLTVNIGNSDTTVCLGAQGNICANVSGGTQPYTYIWNGTSVPLSCVPIPSNTSGTSQITISIIDINNCVTTSPVTKNITVLPALSVNVISNPSAGIVCPDEQVNLIAEGNGGNNGPYTYTWTNDVDGTVLTGANQSVSLTTLTNYTVTVSDGCTSPSVTANLQVDVFPIPNPTFTATPNNGCTPLISEFTHSIPLADIASQQWTFANGETSDLSITTQTFTDEGCTDVNYTITTNDGCVFDTTLTDFVCVNPFPVADFEYSPDSIDIMDTEVTFTNLTTNSDSYLWSFGTGDSTTTVNPVYTYPEQGFRDYTVWLFASNSFGCVDSISKNIHIIELPWYYIPNTFTPEGNNMNELFKPVFFPGFVPYNYTFTIFNRWGEIIYQTNDIYSAWDGVYNGVKVSTGTYAWQIRFTEHETDKRYIEYGHVNVIH
jgi:gliding motility-associated-like protein